MIPIAQETLATLPEWVRDYIQMAGDEVADLQAKLAKVSKLGRTCVAIGKYPDYIHLADDESISFRISEGTEDIRVELGPKPRWGSRYIEINGSDVMRIEPRSPSCIRVFLQD